MGERSFYLPQDLWIQIFDQLDEQNLEVLSLVSKQFLSITNPLKRSLKILDKTLPSLSGILRRFQHLESITISCRSFGSYTDILCQISHSGLHGEGRTNLKRLNFWSSENLDSKDSTAIADLFPWLEEIRFPGLRSLKDCEFQNLQLKFKCLKKVHFGWAYNYQFPSNESLISLSLNCVNLEEIDIEHCKCISQETVGFIMRHSPKLTTLKLPYLPVLDPNTSLSIQNSIAYAKNLHSISFYGNLISKEFVYSFIKANPSLQKFEIDFDYFGSHGEGETSNLLGLFRACSSIQHLCLTGYMWLSDSSVKTISQHLVKLTHIDFSNCSKLTIISFYMLTKNCPNLEEIKLVGTRIGDREISSTDLHKHSKVRHLNLSTNRYLDDKTLGNILQVCPNLQSIDVSCCSRLTKKGISGILKTCVLLTSLKIYNMHDVSNIFGNYFEGKTIGLKVLEAGMTNMNDKVLGRIGKICTRLEFLRISDCYRVTDIGVMEVLRNCKKLKKIDMCGNPDLSYDILGYILGSRPSIKSIVLPSKFVPSQKMRNSFLNIGCKIYYS